MFTYACNAKPPSMDGSCPDDFETCDERDIRGVYGVVTYKKFLPKSDEDIYGLDLVDGPNGRYRVTGVTAQGIRVPQKEYLGKGYDVLRRADMEAIRHDKKFVRIIIEWLGFS